MPAGARRYRHTPEYYRRRKAKRIERDTVVLWRELRALNRYLGAGWKVPHRIRNVLARLAREGATPRIRRIAAATSPRRAALSRKDSPWTPK